MNQSKTNRAHGLSKLKLVPQRESDDTKYHEEPSHGGGNDGGDGMDDLRKRIERTEDNIVQIKIDLAKLTMRSEEFATKSDMLAVKNDLLSLRTELKGETSSIKTELKTETSTLRIEMQKELISIHKEITNQTRWIAGTMLAVAGLSLAVVRYLFA